MFLLGVAAYLVYRKGLCVRQRKVDSQTTSLTAQERPVVSYNRMGFPPRELETSEQRFSDIELQAASSHIVRSELMDRNMSWPELNA